MRKIVLAAVMLFTFGVLGTFGTVGVGLDGYGSASVFVRPGQDRVVDESRAENRVLGSIRFGADGVAMYTAELQRNGKSVARASAIVRVVPPR